MPVIERLPVRGATKATLKLAANNQLRKATEAGYEAAKTATGATGSGRCVNGHKMKNSRDKFCEQCGGEAIPVGVLMCEDGHRARTRKSQYCSRCGKPVALRDPSEPGYPIIGLAD